MSLKEGSELLIYIFIAILELHIFRCLLTVLFPYHEVILIENPDTVIQHKPDLLKCLVL